MPEKRVFPHTIILCGLISIISFYFTQFFAIGNQQRVRCLDEVTVSSPGNNLNVLCQTQSKFFSFLFFSFLLLSLKSCSFFFFFFSKKKINS